MAFKKPTLPKATEAEVFINKSSGTDYSALTLDELMNEYESIDQQSQLLKGRILLEARHRFKSDNEFGAWIESVGGAIYSTSRQHRTKLMNLARFFENRPIEKISISAAYEISAPINADIAIEVYEYAKGRNLPVEEVKKQIAIRKGETVPLPIGETLEKIVEQSIVKMPEKVETITTESLMSKQEQVLDVLKDLMNGEKLKVLRDCLAIVNSAMIPKK